MRYLTADYIFPVSSPPLKNGVVLVHENGVIEDVLPSSHLEALKKNEGIKVETFTGIICPGFVNAHCHLELSHMKGMMSEGKGLPQFIKEVITKRNVSRERILEAIVKAEDEMMANGIVAVGDICNTADTLEQKEKNRIRYYNFIELFDLNESRADDEFEKGKNLLNEFKKLNQPGSLIPHAPYTVSARLLKLLNECGYADDSVMSIHNQETASENAMFREGKGELFQTLSSMGNFYSHWESTGFNSLASSLVHLPKCNKTLLVHNTYSTGEDITWAHLYSQLIYWCFCPNANLFIENRLPDFQLFINSGCKIVVGTDSYASNWSLSILDELKTVAKHAPQIKLNQLIQWATLNGAEFFGFQKELGSIEKGKQPGLNLISDIDTEPLHLNAFSKVQPIVF